VIDQSPQQQGRPSSGEKTEDEIPVSVSSTGRTEPNVLKDNDSEVVNEDQAHAVKDVLRRSNTEMAYSRLIVSLSSGRTLHVHHVTLYDEIKLFEARALLVEISNHLSGSTAELGPLGGSISAIAALSAQATPKSLAGIVSKAKRSQAIRLASSLPTKQQELQDSAIAVGIDRISNIEMPYPNAWYCTVKLDTGLDADNHGRLTRLLRGNWRSITHMDSDEIKRRYVHDGDDFVLLETESGFEYIRWSHVMAYRAEFAVDKR